jgi:hypothetical protein
MTNQIGSPCFPLTEKMVLEKINQIVNYETNNYQKEAKLAVCQHLIDLLHDGRLLTINTDDQIRLWED